MLAEPTCDFCGKTEHDVNHLIPASSDKYICDSCILTVWNKLDVAAHGEKARENQPILGNHKETLTLPDMCFFCRQHIEGTTVTPHGNFTCKREETPVFGILSVWIVHPRDFDSTGYQRTESQRWLVHATCLNEFGYVT